MSLAFWKQCCMYNLANSEDLQSYNTPIVFPSIQRCPLNSSIVQNNINTVLFPLLLLHCATLLVLMPEIHWTCHCALFGLPGTFLAFKYTASCTVSVLEVLVLSKSTLLLWILYWITDAQHITSITEHLRAAECRQTLQPSTLDHKNCKCSTIIADICRNRRWCTFFNRKYFFA